MYNVEKYLEKCLNSCISQDIPSKDYEIIIINDRSTDNSENICNDYLLHIITSLILLRFLDVSIHRLQILWDFAF